MNSAGTSDLSECRRWCVHAVERQQSTFSALILRKGRRPFARMRTRRSSAAGGHAAAAQHLGFFASCARRRSIRPLDAQ